MRIVHGGDSFNFVNFLLKFGCHKNFLLKYLDFYQQFDKTINILLVIYIILYLITLFFCHIFAFDFLALFFMNLYIFTIEKCVNQKSVLL